MRRLPESSWRKPILRDASKNTTLLGGVFLLYGNRRGRPFCYQENSAPGWVPNSPPSKRAQKESGSEASVMICLQEPPQGRQRRVESAALRGMQESLHPTRGLLRRSQWPQCPPPRRMRAQPRTHRSSRLPYRRRSGAYPRSQVRPAFR